MPSAKKLAGGRRHKGRGGVSKSDFRRGARPGLLPTSGPRAPLSAKKQKKLEQKLRLALKRKMEAEGEVEMKDLPASSTRKEKSAAEEEPMQLDIIS